MTAIHNALLQSVCDELFVLLTTSYAMPHRILIDLLGFYSLAAFSFKRYF